MKGILTPEEKRYLKRVSNYLQSLGMTDGTIDFELDYDNFDYDDINWDQITHFSNNYRAEIPRQFVEIVKKIIKYVVDEQLYQYPDVESLSYQNLDVDFDVKDQTISVNHWWSYYAEGDAQETTWEESDEEGEIVTNLFQDLKRNNITPNKYGLLELRYNGGGDSGYLEDQFDNRQDVPIEIKNWCYNQLENMHGGWEINEGSQGYFIFNFKDKVITLEHFYNTEENEHDTIFEEKF